MYMENKFEINIDEVLRYLGYKGQKIDNELIKNIEVCIEEAKELIRPRYTYKLYDFENVEKGIKIKVNSLILESKDIEALLKDSSKCILIAATIGNDIERKINLYSKLNLTKALILDACATTAVEELCDYIEEEIKEELLDKDNGLTYRYSPGYGDLSLEVQKDFITTLGCDKSIGLNVSANLILQPRKSVTAIVGITNKREKRKRNCKNCDNYNRCSFRREDDEDGCFKRN